MGRIAITTGGVKQSLSNYNALKSICEYIWNGFDAGANRIENKYIKEVNNWGEIYRHIKGMKK